MAAQGSLGVPKSWCHGEPLGLHNLGAADGALRQPSDELEEVEQSLKETSSGSDRTALTMTFLAEWGDRSQISTIALAASKETAAIGN
eukprot:Skav219380  [mRNA]  locus=scaffold76:729762:731254:- [translate_table: standard]